MDNYHRYASFEKYYDKFDMDLSLKNVAKFCPLPNRANLTLYQCYYYVFVSIVSNIFVSDIQISCALFLTILK